MNLPSDAHSLPAAKILDELESSAGGLRSSEAQQRLEEYGANQIPSGRRVRLHSIFLRQFLNPLIAILLMVGIVSLAIQHYSDAVFILGVLVFNALIGTFQEYGAEKSAQSLKAMASNHARALRDGRAVDLDATQLVPGDIVLLESGDKVPADLRLLESRDLNIDESLLTGESLAVHKEAETSLRREALLADRVTMAHAGTLVSRGRARGVVVATGLHSQLGRIAESVLGKDTGKTPLLIRMEHFTRNLALLFLVSMLVISAVLLVRGEAWTDVLLIAVALGVAAIPEGLPVALTVALAIASRKMARRNVIVRKLAAVEALGSCTYIGTDKTGTLTRNELTATKLVLPNERELPLSEDTPAEVIRMEGGEPLGRLLEAIFLSTESDRDAVDRALLSVTSQLVPDAQALRERAVPAAVLSYESERGYSAALHQLYGERVLSVKGSPEKISGMCQSAMHSTTSSLMVEAGRLGEQGYRVLAVAGARDRPSLDGVHSPEALEKSLRDLELLGLIALIDPLRPEAAPAIRSATEAGIQVAMITGDHPATARTIASDLGLVACKGDHEVVTGTMLRSARDDPGLSERIAEARVFARVDPDQKLQIVRSLIDSGHFVAVTGDGANDAPALRAANVGIAMGKTGTDVARETADLILADDRFSSLVAAIEEGRIAYSNVRKVIYLLVSTGLSEIFLILFALFAGQPVPLTAVQLLWLNLVTEGIQGVALAFEGAEGDELKRPPRSPSEPIFDRTMKERVVLTSLLIGVVGFGSGTALRDSGMPEPVIQNHVLLLMVIFENMMVLNARSESRPAWKIPFFQNPLLLLGTAAAQLVHIAAMHLPLTQGFLGVQPISLQDWLKHLGLASSLFLVIEGHKLVVRRRLRQTGALSGPSPDKANKGTTGT